MTETNYQVHVHQYKNGALLGQIKQNNEVVKEIWQDPVMNPKVTLHLLRKQVEMMAWTDKI
jgi:hypothetical protein